MNTLYMVALVAAGLAHLFAPDANADDSAPQLTRDMAITQAVASAPSLDALRESVKASTSAIRQAGVKPNPLLTADMENFTGTGPFTGLGQSEITFTYNQRFERGGKRQSRVRFAENDKQIAISQWHITRLDIIRETERAYIDVLVAQARLENLQQQTSIFVDIYETIEARMVRGKDSKLATQNARLHLLQAKNRVAKSQQELDIAKRSLASLWQQPDAAFTVSAEPLFALPENLNPPEMVAIVRGPDLMLWKLRQERSASMVALEKSNAVQDPTFKVGLRYLQGTSDVAAVAGVSLPFALHDTNSGNISKAKAHLRKSQYDLSDAERRLERGLLMQQNGRAAAYRQAKQILRDLIPEAALTEKLVLERLKQGAASYLDVFSAQTLTAGLQKQLITELEQYRLAQVEIDRLTAVHSIDAISSDNKADGNSGQNGEGN